MRRMWAVLALAGVASGTPDASERRAAFPSIDGELHDRAWRDAFQSTDFKLDTGADPALKTRIALLQNDRGLYVALECFEHPEVLKNLAAQVQAHDTDGIWNDDDLELFIAPTGAPTPYYHIIVNARGATWDAFYQAPRVFDKGWEPKYASAVRAGARSWTAEFFLPWDAFDVTPGAGSEWRFNVLRMRQRDREAIYWSPADHAHVPEKFGWLTGLRNGRRAPRLAK